MATTTSAKAARKAAREATTQANADLARRTKLNVDDLTTFFAAMGRAETVDEWLAEKVTALKAQGAQRRDEQRRQAGGALRAMRERGEQVRDIAQLANIGEKQVRELIRLAEAAPASEGEAQDATASPATGGGEAVSPAVDREPAGSGIGETVPTSAPAEGLAAVGQ
ncbi:hypothetical protein OOJ09_31785 [Mesorhizobium qingshengii]|uniref:Uncharacterized protein n=1 Tax=Mesorhizobium qingshengii TaxID=1165689 RepID=A0ABT4R4I9_9HYPH|nr:hypothetical protein [Mesorhizobium qingshengii]MCZ8548750.1 hypothetical protein [Mesorhizobium qingshengii]